MASLREQKAWERAARLKAANFVTLRYIKQTYHDRNVLLPKLGYQNYGEYLISDLWSIIRLRVLTAANHKCVLCQDVATVVHHHSYHREVLLGKDDSFLYAVCEYCHYYIEFKKGHVKRTYLESHTTLQRMLRNRNKIRKGKAKKRRKNKK